MTSITTADAPLAGCRGRAVPFGEAFGIWRMLEQQGHLTPYQTWRWLHAWDTAVLALREQESLALVVEDGDGAVRLALPVAVWRKGGARLASVPGEDHANFKFPLLPEINASADLVGGLREALKAARIDALLLDNMPKDWEGIANPLAEYLTQPGPTPGVKTALVSDPETFFNQRLGHQHRKKLAQKRRGLERLAPVHLVRAENAAEAKMILDAFFEQKAARFREMGVPDVFAEDGIAGFMIRSANEGLEEGNPALRLYALLSGDRVVAIYGGSEHGGRFSASVNAMALDAVRKFSPGDLLLIELLEDCCRRGLKTFDMGLGDFSYKAPFCPDLEPVFDGALPMTAHGAVLARLWLLRRRAKRWLKQHPRLLETSRRLTRKASRG